MPARLLCDCAISNCISLHGLLPTRVTPWLNQVLSLFVPIYSELFGGSDTVYVNIWGKVNGQFVGGWNVYFGDHGAGADPIVVPSANNFVTFQLINPTDTVQYGFTIVNRGGTSLTQFGPDLNKIAEVASTVAEIAGVVGLEEVATFATVLAGVAEGLADIIGALFPDCDGITAAESFQSTKADLDAMLPYPNESNEVSDRGYLGSNSPDGCGAKSYYYASFSIQGS